MNQPFHYTRELEVADRLIEHIEACRQMDLDYQKFCAENKVSYYPDGMDTEHKVLAAEGAAKNRAESLIAEAVLVAALEGYPLTLRDELRRIVAEYHATESGDSLESVKRFRQLVLALQTLGRQLAAHTAGRPYEFGETPPASLALARARVLEALRCA